MRVAAQLIEASAGGHLWADRFDGPLDDIFALQDQVTAGVIGAISPKLEAARSNALIGSRPRICKPTITTFVG